MPRQIVRVYHPSHCQITCRDGSFWASSPGLVEVGCLENCLVKSLICYIGSKEDYARYFPVFVFVLLQINDEVFLRFHNCVRNFVGHICGRQENWVWRIHSTQIWTNCFSRSYPTEGQSEGLYSGQVLGEPSPRRVLFPGGLFYCLNIMTELKS